MNNPETETPEMAVLRQLNEITCAKVGFRPIKSNLGKISTLLKAGFTEQDIVEVIQLKTIQWKNNPAMAQYLCPKTLFRESNFEKYINEVARVKENPELYAEHFARINGITIQQKSAADDDDALSAMYG